MYEPASTPNHRLSELNRTTGYFQRVPLADTARWLKEEESELWRNIDGVYAGLLLGILFLVIKCSPRSLWGAPSPFLDDFWWGGVHPPASEKAAALKKSCWLTRMKRRFGQKGPEAGTKGCRLAAGLDPRQRGGIRLPTHTSQR